MQCKALPAINPKAVNPNDGYLVVQELPTGEFRVVESWSTLQRALKASGVLNDHDLNRGRKETCDVYETKNVTIIKES